MVIDIIVTAAVSIACLIFAGMDINKKRIDTGTWLLLFAGYLGIAITGALIGHDLALWSLS